MAGWRYLLGQFVWTHRLGEVVAAETGFSIRRNPDTVRAPDSAFVSNERLNKHGRPKRGYYPCAPDVAIEVRSPDESDRDVDLKTLDWFNGGALLVWWVDPRKKLVTVYRSVDDIQQLTIKDTLVGDPVLPGFSVALTQIFPAE